jgi:hypothetical protein
VATVVVLAAQVDLAIGRRVAPSIVTRTVAAGHRETADALALDSDDDGI